jgi:hypothetical protein
MEDARQPRSTDNFSNDGPHFWHMHFRAPTYGRRFWPPLNVANKVLSNIYVDNYLDCTETEEEAITLRQDVSALLKLGGFNMVQWLSSSRSVLATIDKNDLSRSLDLDADRLPIERTLGMLWDCQADIFIFKTSTRTDIKTKREILQEISSIYDPMGFLSPVIMVAKILMQDVWRTGINWDDALPPNLLAVWKAWASELEFIAKLKIPRCFRKQSKPLEYELHVFTDASKAGFGACVYIRTKYGEENFSLNLILAKARVAPLRQLSIPRLELQGAVLGARLCASAVKELGPIASNVTYWCDSQTVLQWIHPTRCKYHVFVAHRITEIADTSKASQWRHVPGNLNPADDCSRGISAIHLTTQHRIMRVGGRLQHASIPEFAKHPIILDPTSQLSTMLIREAHERLDYASTEFTLHDLSLQYHVLRPRA